MTQLGWLGRKTSTQTKLTSRAQLHINLLNVVVRIIFFLNSANLICQGTDISKYFRVPGIRDNESRLYLKKYVYYGLTVKKKKKKKKKKKFSLDAAQAKSTLWLLKSTMAVAHILPSNANRWKLLSCLAETRISNLWWAFPVSIQHKSIAGRYRPVSYPDGPITTRYRFM